MIYTIQTALGDCWASVNHLARWAIESKQSLIINPSDGDRDRSGLITEIIDVLDLPEKINITFTDAVADKCVRPRRAMKDQYYPTKMRWVPGPYYKICYQFDGVYRGHRKNPPKDDIPKLTSFLPNFKFIQLSKDKSLKECVEIMARSDLFLGADSGFSHASHSVGIPTFIIKYNSCIEKWHHGKQYILCNGTEDAIDKVKKYLSKQK